MAVSVTCPGCATSYPVTDEILGKTIRCKKCQETFVARTAKSAATAGRGDERITTKPAAKATVRDEYDDSPANGKVNGKARAVPARKPAKKGGNGTLIAAGSAAGVLILGLVGALMWALNRGDEPTDNGSASVTPPKKAVFGAPATPVAPVVNEAASESKPAEPQKADQPKAVQAAKIEHVSLPGFVRQRRPAEFDPALVHKAKQKAVMLLCMAEGGGAWGSGWIAEQNGDERYIVTNAHVVLMLERVKPPPDSIKVYVHAGTDRESILEGRLLAVDHDHDLAVVRVKGRDKRGDPLPEPFKISPSYDLVPGQKLITLGFPSGGDLAKMMADDSREELRAEVKTRTTSVSGRIPNKDGSIKYIQIEGGADPGNSGGGVIDTNGNIVATVVAQLGITNMKFVIPSEYAYHLLVGRVLKIVPGQAVKSGSGVKQPIRSYAADPLHRIARITGEVWTGKPGAVRSAALTQPSPVEGDGPRVTFDMSYNRDQDIKLGDAYTTDAEANLPPLKEGDVYWFQPHYVGRDGKDRWGEAIVVEMGRYPVEAKPVNLSVKHKTAAKLDDVRAIELDSRQIVGSGLGGRDMPLKTSLTERTDSVDKNGDASVTYQYTNVRLRDEVEDEMVRRQVRGLLESARLMKSKAVITKEGQLRQSKPDLAQVVRGAQATMEAFNLQVMEALESLAIPLPNKEVSPGETWDTDVHYSVTIGKTTRNIVLRSKAKYVGSRVRDGREEAVVELTGRAETDTSGSGGRGGRGGSGPSTGDDSRGATPGEGGTGGDDEPNQQRAVRGVGHGAAVIDLQTGHVVYGRVESEMAATFVVPVPLRNGQTRDVRILVGFYQDSFGRRSLTKAKPPEFDPSRLLPNQVRVYNPLVGAADPTALSESPAAELPSNVPVRVGDMKPEAYEKARKASVMVDVTTATGGGTGSGWFAEPGIVVTNCHVVDMLSKTDRKPEKIVIYVERGTPAERKLDGELLTVNRKEDLAVIRVKGAKLPEPFAIVGQESLGNSQRLTIHGFPLGTRAAGMLAINVATGQDFLTTLKSRPTTVVGRVPHVDGSVKYVQLEGGADPGNSGGPITDVDGNVRLILVAGIPGTQMRFAIPSEYAARMLNGYPMEVEPGYAFMDGSTPKQPISILFADPLKRLKKVWVDVWVGNPGKPRQGGSKEPKPKEGDGERMSIEVPFAPDKTGLFMEVKSEIPIPRIAPGQIYYFQPRFINGTGTMHWGQALPFAPDGPPVERKPAQLLVKHVKNAAPRFLELTSEMTQASRDIAEGTEVKGFPLKATYAETVLDKTRKGDAVTDLKCTNFTWAFLEDDFFDKNPEFAEFFDPEVVKLIKQFLNLYKQIQTQVVFHRDGRMLNNPKVQMPGGLPPQAFALLPDFHQQLLLSLQALSIPLPNKEVQYGHTWTTTTNLFIPASRSFDSGVFEMKMKYVGVRDRGGRREAVIEIEGNLARDKSDKSAEMKTKDGSDAKGDEPKPDDDPPAAAPYQYKGKDEPKGRRAVYGVGHGYAYVDIDGGYVSDCQLFIDLEVEVIVKDKDTKQEVPQVVSGDMKVGMKRMTSAGRAK